jgi:ribosomal protein S18 acetylase RimI-like enzyme
LRLHPTAVRIFSIAVHPAHRGAGLGSALLRRAFAEARCRKALRLTLEADADDRRLVDWYAGCGFARADACRTITAPAATPCE